MGQQQRNDPDVALSHVAYQGTDRGKARAVTGATRAPGPPSWGSTSCAAGAEGRPFRVDVPEGEIAELRRRIAATRWPERETVSDDSQGVRLALMQELARYWAADYDWRKCEATLNALPQFMTEIDGLDIHFIHVRSQHPGALPLIVTHGWPGSIIEPLTNPTAHGASAADGRLIRRSGLPFTIGGLGQLAGRE